MAKSKTRTKKNVEENGKGGSGEGLDQALSAAIRAAQGAPDSAEAWDHLEELADSLQKPDAVAEVYRSILSPKLPRELLGTLSERAVAFHEEWFGDNPEQMNSVLSRIIEIDPEAAWAFERLTVVLTVAERWDDLLLVYDKTIEMTDDLSRRKQLLDDAANAAKSLANKPDRAVDYMMELYELDQENHPLAASIERMLEKLERFDDLVGLWQRRMAVLSGEEERKTRLKIVDCCLENLQDPARALGELRLLTERNPGDKEGCAKLEFVLDDAGASPETRMGALALLRSNYDAAGKPEALVAAIKKATAFASPGERLALHREAGLKLTDMGKDLEALEHFAALLDQQPSDIDARKQLRQSAARSNRRDIQAEALIRAAGSCEDATAKVALQVEAAYLYWEFLDNVAGAIDLFQQVLETPDTEPSIALAVAHNLNELLGAAGRREERLNVLERLAKLERAAVVRKTILGEAAGMAAELGDTDKALSFWEERLKTDANDIVALSAIVDLLTQNERWEAMIGALRRRAASAVLPQQRRTDLVLIARTQADRLEQVGAAIETWLKVLEEFGIGLDIMEALDRLMSKDERWEELARLLGHVAETGYKQVSDLLCRLGDIHRTKFNHVDKAARYYAQTLMLEPSNEGAQAGLKELINEPDATQLAVQALTQAYGATDNWQASLALLEPQLLTARDNRERARILAEAARLEEQKAKDVEAAFSSVVRALPIDPTNTTLEQEILRLAEETKRWAEAADALRSAAGVVVEYPARIAHLRFLEGDIREFRLGDLDGALAAYSAVVEVDSSRTDALHAVIRVSAQAGLWDMAAQSLVSTVVARGRMEPRTIDLVENTAEKASAWDKLTESMAKAIREREFPHPDLARDLEIRLAGWHLQKRGDPGAAEAAAARAAALDPQNLETLKLLASLQGRSPGAPFIATLQRIHALAPSNLDPLRRAAEVAIEAIRDYGAKRSVLVKLLQEASRIWRYDEKASGEATAEASALWAIEEIVRLDVAAGETEQAAQILLDGARLPCADDIARKMRIRAVELLKAEGKSGRAVEIYRDVRIEEPGNEELLAHIAPLLEQENRIPELLVVLRRELDLTPDPERRLALRLAIARFVGLLEGKDERVRSLRANLDESPGHPESIQAITELLRERSRHLDLVALLEEQAARLQRLGKAPLAAELWEKAGALAEEFAGDPKRAIALYEKAVELNCRIDTLDALSRLNLGAGNPAEAANWLRRRLVDTEDPKERVAILIRLARAQIQASQLDRATMSLETAFSEAPRNAEVRKLLFGQYRAEEKWGPLAAALSKATEVISDEPTILAFAREAADIYFNKLGAPKDAVPILERALPFAGEDRELKQRLAEGLLLNGRFGEARKIVQELLEDFGRRRSAERADVHLLLARVERAMGNTDEALDQLDKASKMDSQNIDIWQALAELARETGQLDRAERAYRTLLLMVRRGEPGKHIGASEVFVELAKIAEAEGQTDQAAELRESALEAMSKSDGEALRLQKKLLKEEDWELLRRVYETRLGLLENKHQRAETLSGLADLLEGPLGRPEEAMEVRLNALREEPGSPSLHDAAYGLAAQVGGKDAYIETLEALLKTARRGSDANATCEILLRLGKAMETDRADLDKAQKYYAKAEETGVREVDVWRAAVALAQKRDDKAEQMRLLTNLASLGEDAEAEESRADALYRLAEVQLSSPDTMAAGLDSLEQAIKENPRYGRSGRILRRACETHEPDEKLLAVYEKVARQANDDEMLLDYLERRADAEPVAPEQIREGAALAEKLGALERAEALMLRAVEVAEEESEGGSDVAWALLGLAARRKALGDLAGAVKWLTEASEVAEQGRVFALAREIMEGASGPDGDLTLPVKLYEQLLEQNPTAVEVWEPLAEMYSRLGDAERLGRMVEGMLDSLSDPRQRNTLRLKQAKLFLEREDRKDEAVETLKAILLEDPEHGEATETLAGYFERTGSEGEMLELLRSQFDAARSRKDAKATRICALRLGKALAEEDREAAIAVYRAALKAVPDDRDLLYGLLDCAGDDQTPEERALLMEKILASEQDDRAAELALRLVEIYESLGNEKAVLRALDLGIRRAPSSRALTERLEKIYRDRGDDAGLAKTLVQMAENNDDLRAKVAMLKEAAAIYRGPLSDAKTAIAIIKQACALEPETIAHRVELVDLLVAAGSYGDANAQIAVLMENPNIGELYLDLLRTRAKIHIAGGDPDAAVADLEQAYERNREAIAPDLEDALRQRRALSAQQGNRELERSVTRRLLALLTDGGKLSPATDLLEEWVRKEPGDTEMLYRLLDLYEAAEQYADAARVLGGLIPLEKGEEQVRLGQRYAEACIRAGNPESARVQLEQIYLRQPESQEIRAELRRIYEQSGAQKELAMLLKDDAQKVEDPAERAGLLRQVGVLLLSINEPAEAAPALRAALELLPGDMEATAALADVYLANGDIPGASSLLDDAMARCKGQRSPELCVLQHRKSRVARAEGDRAGELAWLKQAMLSDRGSGWVAVELADRAEEYEDWDMAIWALRTIAMMKEETPLPRAEVFLRQGKIALVRGDEKRAKLFARQAQQEDPESESVKAFLASLGAG